MFKVSPAVRIRCRIFLCHHLSSGQTPDPEIQINRALKGIR